MDDLFWDYVERLKSELPESAVIFFGSRARGSHMPYSDYDLMVIVGDGLNASEAFDAAVRVKPKAIPVDLVVLTLEELRDPLRAKMLEEGCVALYDGLGVSRLGLPCRRARRGG
jgi:hypothetical protein